MKRKSSKNTRGPNIHEKYFQLWLKRQPCCITGRYPVEVHHCKGATFKNNKVLIGHWFCLPLCKEVHDEYHAGTKLWREKYGKQSDLWLEQFHKYMYRMDVTKDGDPIVDAIMGYGR